MKESILQIICDEKESLWRDLNDCIRCEMSDDVIKCARARWAAVESLYIKIERDVKND